MADKEDFLDAVNALGHVNRVRIVMLLTRHREICGCHIACALGICRAGISAHLKVLCRARMVNVRAEGNMRYFSLAWGLADPRLSMLIHLTRIWVSGDPLFEKDLVAVGQAMLSLPACLKPRKPRRAEGGS